MVLALIWPANNLQIPLIQLTMLPPAPAEHPPIAAHINWMLHTIVTAVVQC